MIRRLDGELRRYLDDTCLPFEAGIHLLPLPLLETVRIRDSSSSSRSAANWWRTSFQPIPPCASRLRNACGTV